MPTGSGCLVLFFVKRACVQTVADRFDSNGKV